MQSAALEIQMLGPVVLRVADHPLKISRRLERALLYFLAGEHRPVSRTTLIDMLWPEADQADPRRSLRTALSRLRRELPAPGLLITKMDQVWLDTARCQIDLLQFELSYQSLRDILSVYQENRPLPVQIVKQIEDALVLWKGDFILQGDNLNDYPKIEIWRQGCEQALRRQRKHLMKRLGEHYHKAGQPEQALEHFTRLGQVDVLDMAAHLSVLDLLVQVGQHHEVLAYCDALEGIFEQEFHAPLPDQILALCRESHRQIHTAEISTGFDWQPAMTRQLPLVAREFELTELSRAFYRGGVVVVQGEMGMGKTRLISELFQTLIPKPMLVFAPAWEIESQLPLSPIIHAFRQHIPEETWQAISTVWARQLTVILPELVEIRKDCAQVELKKHPFGQQQLFDALYQVLLMVVQKNGRILFVLEDAQWADKQTLEALSYLVHKGLFKQHGLLVIVSRTEDPNPCLELVIDQIQKVTSVNKLTLNGLTLDELSDLAALTVDETPSLSFLNQLFQETKGNPFLALEIIHDILETPGSRTGFDEGKRLPLPASVHTLIRRRLNRLDERNRHILLYAAVIGTRFSLRTIQAVLDLKFSPDSAPLASLVDHGFFFPIHVKSSKSVSFQFVHEKMREVILKEAPLVQQKQLHALVAEHLAQRPQAETKAKLIADHFLQSGDLVNAFRWLLKAAERAKTLGLNEEVISAYQKAENLYLQASADTFSHEDILDLYKRWGEYAYLARLPELVEETGIKLQVQGMEKNQPLLAGVAQISLANVSFLRGDYETSLNMVNQAINFLEVTQNTQELFQAYYRKAVILWWMFDFTGALKSAQKMLQISEKLVKEKAGSFPEKFKAEHMIGMIYFALGDAQKTLTHAQAIHYKYFYLLESFNQSRSLYLLAHANLISANFEECDRLARKGLKITKDLVTPFSHEIHLGILGRSALNQGHIDEAYLHAIEALALGEKHNHRFTIVAANCLLGNIYFLLHNYTAAMQHFRTAQLREGFKNLTYYGIDNNIFLSWLLIWLGQDAEAREIINPMLKITKKAGAKKLYTQALMVCSACDLINRNFQAAETKLNKALEIGERNELVYQIAWIKLHQARLALSQGQFTHSEQLLIALFEDELPGKLAWFTLNALDLCAQLKRASNRQTAFLKNRPVFKKMVDKLEAHTRSESLRLDFVNAKRYWDERLDTP